MPGLLPQNRKFPTRGTGEFVRRNRGIDIAKIARTGKPPPFGARTSASNGLWRVKASSWLQKRRERGWRRRTLFATDAACSLIERPLGDSSTVELRTLTPS